MPGCSRPYMIIIEVFVRAVLLKGALFVAYLRLSILTGKLTRFFPAGSLQ